MIVIDKRGYSQSVMSYSRPAKQEVGSSHNNTRESGGGRGEKILGKIVLITQFDFQFQQIDFYHGLSGGCPGARIRLRTSF